MEPQGRWDVGFPMATMGSRRKVTPLARLGEPEDTGATVAFLCAPDRCGVVGASCLVDSVDITCIIYMYFVIWYVYIVVISIWSQQYDSCLYIIIWRWSILIHQRSGPDPPGMPAAAYITGQARCMAQHQLKLCGNGSKPIDYHKNGKLWGNKHPLTSMNPLL